MINKMKNDVIICVDDERIVLNGLHSQLSREFGTTFSIELAESGEEALDLIKEIIATESNIPIVISDQLMPGIKGHELLKQIHLTSPETYTVLLTGQSDLLAVTEAVNHANLYRYISKPWENHDLILTVREAIKGFYQDRQLASQNQLLERHNKELEKLVEERTQKLIISEKMAAVGIVATRMSHEILNPLNFVQNFSELSSNLVIDLMNTNKEAEKREVADLLIENLKKIREHGSRAVAIVAELQAYTTKGNAHEYFESSK
jgi:YesN/AraC family two-component response regulator